MDPKELLQKATMVVSDLSGAGVLNPEQANQFIDMMQNDTVMSREARIVKMNSPKQRFNKLGFDTRIMAPGAEGVDPGNESKPTADYVELTTTEGVAIVKISYNVFEDNIERASLADHIVRLIAERSGVDVEEQHVMGDTGSGDAWLAQNAGVFALATSHVADAFSLTDPTDVLAALDAGYKVLPKKYLRNKRDWRYFLHADAEFQLRQALSERATGAGDRFLLEDAPVLVRGIPVVALPAIAELADYDGAGAGTGVGSNALLVHPQNVVIGIQRQISIESDRLIRERAVEYVATIRSDVEFEEEDAVAKIAGIKHA